ncbi:Holliday junction branch migration protein RuvA [candidate division KSB1 bacterium]|nr:Holliday junction branch migration protein RuvA [candidate division KSB1 bacterium]
MIGQLQGRLLDKSPTRVVLDVSGVGYEVMIPLSTFEQLGSVGENATLLTHLHVREDALQLFGFATQNEKHLFQLLLTVNGVGPKLAQGILSGCSVEVFCNYVKQNAAAALTAIPGIGKKTAERLVMELRDRITHLDLSQEQKGVPTGPAALSEEALLALISLGYARADAEKAIRQALAEHGELAVEELLKHALRNM